MHQSNQFKTNNISEHFNQRLLAPISLIGAVAVCLTGLDYIRSAEEISEVNKPVTVFNSSAQPVAPNLIVVEPIHLRQVSLSRHKPAHHSRPTPTDVPAYKAAGKQVIKPKPIVPRVQPKRITYGALRRTMRTQLDNVPMLPEAAQLFPDAAAYQNIAEQLAHIKNLRETVTVSIEDYKNFKVNTEFIHAFDDQPNYSGARISPRMIIEHWTVNRYPDGVQQFIAGMHAQKLRTMFFTDHDSGEVYQLFDEMNRFPQHAKGANQFSQGNEIEAKDMLDITPEEHKSAVLLAVKYNQQLGLKPSRKTILGHYAVDLLYHNPTYDGKTGTFHDVPGHKPYIDKFDPPQEYINLVADQANELYQQLNE